MGAGAMTNSIGEIRDVDFLFVIGSNTTEAHPIIAMEMKKAVQRGAKLVVADPRAIWLTQVADRHLQLRPGTDVWLLNAMANVILENDLANKEFIENSTEGYEEFSKKVSEYTPEKAEKITGVPAKYIRDAAIEYASTKKAGIYYTLGITEHSHGTDNVFALSNLVLMTGHLGFPSTGMNPLRGQNNVQGANDAGATPIFLPGYQRVDDPKVHAKYVESWGVNFPSDPGLNLNEMMKKIGSGIHGLFIMGEDIVLSEPNACELDEHMQSLEFVVMQDIFLNGTSRFADVILPGACFAEKDGVFTNSERRVQRVRKAVEPPGNARADWEILIDFANASGANWTYKSTNEIYNEYVKDAPKFAGLSHERIENEGGLHWPCYDHEDSGTPFLHKDGIMRGKGKLMPVDYRPSLESGDEDFPMILSTGRTLYHYNAATQTRFSGGTSIKQPEAFLQIHPRDARFREITDGDFVEVKSRRGALTCRAQITREVNPGYAWMPFHFIEARANVLTNDEGDTVTGTAEYKVCAIEVSKN